MRVFAGQALAEIADLDRGVERLDVMRGDFSLALAGLGILKDGLAVEVGGIDHVIVDDGDLADAGAGKIRKRRCAEAASADDEDAGVFEALLHGGCEVRQRELAAVAGEIVGGEVSHDSPSCHPERRSEGPQSKDLNSSPRINLSIRGCLY